MNDYIWITTGKSMEGTVQDHCFSSYINKCKILKTITQLKNYIKEVDCSSAMPASRNFIPRCYRNNSSLGSEKEGGSLLWDCLDAGPCSHTWEPEGDWHKHEGFHWIKHCMCRPECSSIQLAVPRVFSSEGKAKQVLQTHCGDLKKQFCFKTALTRLFG